MDKIETKFQHTLDLLRDPEATFTAEAIYSLSDLMGEQLDRFRALWPGLPAERRRTLIARLVETAETNFELDFSSIIHPALDDPNEEVRKNAIDGVYEESPPAVVERLMKIAQDDPFSAVRATALSALGQFVLQGELGKLASDLNTRLQDTVLALHRNVNEDPDVRRRALEAIANCSRKGVLDLIHEAYYADDLRTRASAVFAMGRSCDQAWTSHILHELDNDEPEMRYEAARAAGELELHKALPRLAELAYEDDREIQGAAIWALGEIGGETASQVLNQLATRVEEIDDSELYEAIQEAQATAQLGKDDLLPCLDFSAQASFDVGNGDSERDGFYGNGHDDEDAV